MELLSSEFLEVCSAQLIHQKHFGANIAVESLLFATEFDDQATLRIFHYPTLANPSNSLNL